MDTMPDVDVAIVGGGMSGIYTGWRLLTSKLTGSKLAGWEAARGKLKVALFEGSGRIGGRLLSARSPHMPETTAEVGGMRYVAPAQTLVTSLVECVLKLPWHEQVVDLPGNIAFLRGKLLRTSDLGNAAALPYWLDPAEAAWLVAGKGGSPAGLIGRVLTRLMPDLMAHLNAGTLRQYLETVMVDGLPLWQHGLWNLLAKGMSADGYAAARATVGYDCLGGNTNALDLTAEYFDFTPNVSYRIVDAGYERVPFELQSRFQAAGGEIQFQQWLAGFSGTTLDDGSNGLTLRFQDGTTKTARAIVLAMPRRSIELLDPYGEVLGPANTQFRQDLASVAPIPLFKCFLLYPNCWWQDSGVSSGRSLTDMPIRQCYYWPSGPQGTTIPKRDGPGLVMVYDDLLNVSFWEGLDKRAEVHKVGLPLSLRSPGHHWAMFERKAAEMTAEPADSFGKRLAENWTEHPATRQMVNELHRQLMQMHGKDSAPEPIDAAYMDWSRDPFGGGVHLWNVNVRSDVMLTRMTQPVDNFPCYICGEAYSTNQTWAEGALQTAEIVLQQRLGVAKGEWQDG
ncbi:FAD-dependent oxidoreductase [Rhizobium calliandrae]|uniref:Tryptophan 2-monooxygenase n=1 Tax=Rhizobium calliandrae TaxID=1312182 RepID=A0ABT7KQQ7_9HYPH|nr:FAD-dependent oxidoreductase [Rhizobium calliandrae]MDL2409594.1 FAD-dependent oxidoreductase [Rhizobium calliandrae]